MIQGFSRIAGDHCNTRKTQSTVKWVLLILNEKDVAARSNDVSGLRFPPHAIQHFCRLNITLRDTDINCNVMHSPQEESPNHHR